MIGERRPKRSGLPTLGVALEPHAQNRVVGDATRIPKEHGGLLDVEPGTVCSRVPSATVAVGKVRLRDEELRLIVNGSFGQTVLAPFLRFHLKQLRGASSSIRRLFGIDQSIELAALLVWHPGTVVASLCCRRAIRRSASGSGKTFGQTLVFRLF